MSSPTIIRSETRYVFRTIIHDVIHKEMTVGGKKSADGTAELFVEDAGWYIRLGNLSIYMGHEEPALKSGQRVRLIIEADNVP